MVDTQRFAGIGSEPSGNPPPFILRWRSAKELHAADGLKYNHWNNHFMATSILRRWGRSLGIVVPREEVLRKGLRPGQRVEVTVADPTEPDDFSDLAGTVRWRKESQDYKDELRRLSRS